MKEVKPLFQAIGRRRKLIGFEAFLDGAFIGVYGSRDDAMAVLDKITFEMAVAS